MQRNRGQVHIKDERANVRVKIEKPEKKPISIGNNVPITIGGKKYDGAYSITPGPDATILETKDMLLSENITVAPIPKNYGLIGFDGSTLTVS